MRVGLAAARALAFAWGAELVGYPTLDLVAAIARDREPGPVTVAMTGGHGEWFVQNFDGDGTARAALASLTPAAAATAALAQTVAGSQAEALVAARGHGQAMALWPDARALPLLPPAAFTAEVHPLYGRAPDAKLPQVPA